MLRAIAVALVLALAASACGAGTDDGEQGAAPPPAGTVRAEPGELRGAGADGPDTPVDPDALAAVGRAASDLSFDLMRQDPEARTVSGLSLYVALAMLRAGARAETAAQIDIVLGAEDGDAAEWRDAVGALRAALRTPRVEGEADPEDGDVLEVLLADSAWVQAGFDVRQEYLDTLTGAFDASLHVVDYAGDPDGAVDAINGWVADQTRDRITDLLESVDPSTVLALVDALTFTASWQKPFVEDGTAPAPFTTDAGERVEVPTMQQTELLPHASVDGLDVVALPYVGEAASMLLLVPPDGGLDEVVAELDATHLAALRAALEPTPVELHLPRWENRTRIDLVEPLQALGVVDAFDPSAADLSGIAGEPRDLVVDQALQQAMIEVDEHGTRAAAATALTATPTSGVGESVTVRADRPFAWVIVDHATDAVLFAGTVTDPRP